jgi:RimJ/RimL family protein N-acetyltransferase
MSDIVYPRTIQVAGSSLTLRRIADNDKEKILEFARALPEEDLLFLSFDITRENVVESWIKWVKSGLWDTILAEVDGKIVGHGTLLRTEQIWTRHLGEIILLVLPSFRGRGIGSLLANEIFAKAKSSGLMKIVARMAAEQKSAIAVFEKMGFRIEALLGDYVIDLKDHTHDLVAMSYDIRGFNETF